MERVAKEGVEGGGDHILHTNFNNVQTSHILLATVNNQFINKFLNHVVF